LRPLAADDALNLERRNVMTTVSTEAPPTSVAASERAGALADRLEQGARALAALATTLTDEEWRTPLGTTDKRTIGVIVHHVASIYTLEIQLAQVLAQGQPIKEVTWDAVAQVNAQHAKENEAPTKAAALELLARNSAAAAAAIRALTDAELAQAAPVSLYGDAPLTCQFFLEDHAVRHSYHHLAKIRKALGR
jgi:DinB family protein